MKRTNVPRGGDVASEEEAFVRNGLAAVELELSNCTQGLAHHWACLMIQPSDYDWLLRDAFHRRPLLTGAKDASGGPKPVRFRADKKLFLEDDGRLIVPMNSYCRYIREAIKQAGDGDGRVDPMTNIGAEVLRQIQAGSDDPNPLQCDDKGNYVGALVNGEIMPHKELSKLHRSRRCQVCQNETIKLCGSCDIAYYCSEACQRSDWLSHKHICGQVKLNDNDEPVVVAKT
jgi:hypothetical protein